MIYFLQILVSYLTEKVETIYAKSPKSLSLSVKNFSRSFLSTSIWNIVLKRERAETRFQEESTGPKKNLPPQPNFEEYTKSTAQDSANKWRLRIEVSIRKNKGRAICN